MARSKRTDIKQKHYYQNLIWESVPGRTFSMTFDTHGVAVPRVVFKDRGPIDCDEEIEKDVEYELGQVESTFPTSASLSTNGFPYRFQRLSAESNELIKKVTVLDKDQHDALDSLGYVDRRFRFMDLPLELRNEVYRYYFEDAKTVKTIKFLRHGLSPSVNLNVQTIDFHYNGQSASVDLRLLRTSRVIYQEASSIFYGEKTFMFRGSKSWARVHKFIDFIGKHNAAHIRSVALDDPFIFIRREEYPYDLPAEHERYYKYVFDGLTSLSKKTSIATINLNINDRRHRPVRENEAIWAILSKFMHAHPAVQINVLAYHVTPDNPPRSQRVVVDRLVKNFKQRLHVRVAMPGICPGTWFFDENPDTYLDGLRWMFEDGNWYEVERARFISRDHGAWQDLQRLLW